MAPINVCLSAGLGSRPGRRCSIADAAATLRFACFAISKRTFLLCVFAAMMASAAQAFLSLYICANKFCNFLNMELCLAVALYMYVACNLVGSDYFDYY